MNECCVEFKCEGETVFKIDELLSGFIPVKNSTVNFDDKSYLVENVNYTFKQRYSHFSSSIDTSLVVVIELKKV